MNPSTHQNKKVRPLRKVLKGFSLIEVMMIISMLSVIIIPFVMTMTQTSLTARGAYIHSSRSIILNSLMDEMEPERMDFYASYNDASKNTTISESGQTIPFMRKMSTSATLSDTLQKTVYVYLYNNTSDADSSPRYRATCIQSADQHPHKVGSYNITDNAGYLWFPDTTTYDSATMRPGRFGGSMTGGSSITNIVNTTGSDDYIYQSWREGDAGGNVEYNFDLLDGVYTVDLMFAEMSSTVTGSAPNRRLMDIYLEGTKKNSAAYSPYETTGGLYRAHIMSYDVEVTDGTLNVSVRKNASSNLNARLHGIVVKKRRMQ